VDKADKDDQANVIQSLAAEIETIRASSGDKQNNEPNLAAEIETIRASSGDKQNNEPNLVEAERQTDLQSKAWDDMLARFADLEAEHERVKAELSRSCPMVVDYDEKVEKNICLDEVKEKLHEANDQLLETENKGMTEKIRWLEEEEEELKEDIRYNKMEIQDLKEQVQMRKEETKELRDETGKTNVHAITISQNEQKAAVFSLHACFTQYPRISQVPF
jgi:chromosome segregation ATPase